MKEISNGEIQHQVKDRPALERRLMRLLWAVHRFSRARASTRRMRAAG
jgi:hypothetical protein